MNISKARQIVSLYESDFKRINEGELYKWRAIKCFQDNWDVNAPDFVGMLRKSLAEASNLLSGSNYFPERMLFFIGDKAPDVLRLLFQTCLMKKEIFASELLNSKPGSSN